MSFFVVYIIFLSNIVGNMFPHKFHILRLSMGVARKKYLMPNDANLSPAAAPEITLLSNIFVLRMEATGAPSSSK